MFQRLLHRFRMRRPYRIFTTDYDQEIHARELLAEIDQATSPGTSEASTERTGALREALARTLAPLAASAFSVEDRVILLVDHSGSMKGLHIGAARVIVEELAGFFDARGVPWELLGYTTRNWRGGRSRQRWIECGRPRKPGRLCDLRHLVYRSFSEKGDWRDALRLMTADILREGVDGEAVAWAADRMPEASPHGRRMIVHLGDASPVDDSTQQANGMWILEDHFIEATRRVQSGGVKYVLMTFRLWQADIPQVHLSTDEVRCASAVGDALRALFIPAETDRTAQPSLQA